MSQSEIVQALKNLGGRALKSKLLEEYFRLHYPDEKIRDLYTKNRSYHINTVIARYITKLRNDHIINSRRVFVAFDENHKRTRGQKINQTEYYLIQQENA